MVVVKRSINSTHRSEGLESDEHVPVFDGGSVFVWIIGCSNPTIPDGYIYHPLVMSLLMKSGGVSSPPPPPLARTTPMSKQREVLLPHFLES